MVEQFFYLTSSI